MLSDLAGIEFSGFGESTMAELAELRKALDIGVTQPPTGFDSLRIESLEQTLKILTFRQENIALWREIPKSQAFSTIEEYNRLEKYGTFENGVFNPSGVLPEEQDSVYSRQNQLVKFLGTTRVVTHPSTLVRTAPADLIAQETQNGALFLMGKVNEGLYFADSTIVPEEYNGVQAQIVSGAGNVIDLRGGPLTQDSIEDGVQRVLDNFGNPSLLFSNNAVFGDFSKTFHNFQRFAAPNVGQGVVGTPVSGFSSQAGTIGFRPDTFVRPGGAPPAAATSSKAPNAPTQGFTIRDAATTISAGLTSQFGSGDAGDYKYQVTAINRFGESAPSTLSAAQTVVAGGSVEITITDGGGAEAATGYKIYRIPSAGGADSTIVQMVRVARDAVTPADTVHNDVNDDIPGTFVGLLLDMSDQSLTFRQLSPMIRMPLATIAPSIRWMQLIYGTPVVYQPKRNVVYKNIGRI